MKQYLGIDGSIDTMDGPYGIINPISVVDTLDISNNPLLQFDLQNAAVGKANVKVEKSQFLPKFSLSYDNLKYNDVTGFNAYQAGISIPLWFLPQKNRVRAAKADAMV
ncbi:TolC family protein, partial [Maribacter cobaltidurans]|uniref:TolC family protein n=1 Tax=Maribacter cobaltidurans TaxID=1178778 RepID=UPI001E63F863